MTTGTAIANTRIGMDQWSGAMATDTPYVAENR